MTALTILVVDDNRTNLAILFGILNAQGHRVLLAEDGHGALRIAQSIAPDFVLLDVLMPDLDGFATLAALRKLPNTHSVPVVMMTASPDEVTRRQIRDASASDLIHKPLRAKQIQQCIERLFQHSFRSSTTTPDPQPDAFLNTALGTIAHDLFAHIGTASGFCEVLNDDLPADSFSGQCLQSIQEATRQLQYVTETLVLLRSLQDFQPQPVAIDLVHSLKAAADSHASTLNSTKPAVAVGTVHARFASADPNLLAELWAFFFHCFSALGLNNALLSVALRCLGPADDPALLHLELFAVGRPLLPSEVADFLNPIQNNTFNRVRGIPLKGIALPQLLTLLNASLSVVPATDGNAFYLRLPSAPNPTPHP